MSDLDGDSGDLHKAFAAQRRLLLGVSLTLSAILVAGIRVPKLSVFGAEISIERPESLTVIGFTLWVYALIRFLQFRSDLDDDGKREALSVALLPFALKNGVQIFRESLNPGMQDLEERGEIEVLPTTRVVTRAGTNFEVVVEFMSPSDQRGHRQSIVPVKHFSRVDLLRAELMAAIRTRFFTEYDLPILLALMPPAIRLVQFGRDLTG